MKRQKPERQGDWTEMPEQARKLARRRECSCCTGIYGRMIDRDGNLVPCDEAIDHIFPRRWLRRNFPAFDCHSAVNLLSVCTVCHGLKLQYENDLLSGNVLSFLLGLRKIHYPIGRVKIVASVLGLREVEGWDL